MLMLSELKRRELVEEEESSKTQNKDHQLHRFKVNLSQEKTLKMKRNSNVNTDYIQNASNIPDLAF